MSVEKEQKLSKEERKLKKLEKKKKKAAKAAQALKIAQSTSSVEASPFLQLTTALYLSLSPNAYHFPLSGLVAEHLSPNIMTYYPPLQGVLLAFQNPRITEHPTDQPTFDPNSIHEEVLTRSIDENAVTYVWLTAEFLVFRPRRGTVLEGIVSVSNESLLGLICYNYFNAAIDRTKLPEEWKWEDGRWLNGEGNDIPTKLQFTVEDLEVSGADSMSIRGSLLAPKG